MLSALDHVQTKAPKGLKILIYMDNENTVNIFWSLKCLPVYNHLLKSAIDILIKNDYTLHVLHIPGKDNIVTDALSQVKFSVALQTEPKLKLYNFNPPSMVGSAGWFKVILDLVSQLELLGLKITFSKNMQSLLDKLLTNQRLKLTVHLLIPIWLLFSYIICWSNPLQTLCPSSLSSCHITLNLNLSGPISLEFVNNLNHIIPSWHTPLVKRTMKGSLHLHSTAKKRKWALTISDLSKVVLDLVNYNEHKTFSFVLCSSLVFLPLCVLENSHSPMTLTSKTGKSDKTIHWHRLCQSVWIPSSFS